MLQHYVFLKFAENTPGEHRDEFCRRMLALKERISEIKEIEIGTDILHEARSWSLLIQIKVADLDALVRYQKHPDHQALVAFNAPYVADIGVIDFEAFLEKIAHRA